MKKFLALAGLVLCLSAGTLWAQEKIVIGGSGGLRDEMQDLAKIYMAKHPADSIEVSQESLGTAGEFEWTKVGRFQIAVVTRRPNDSEKGGLVYRPVVRAPVGIGVHKSTLVSNLTESQICDVFSGKIKFWKEVGGGEGKIVVLTRKKADDASVMVISDKMACFKGLKISSEAVALIRGGEVLDALNHRPGTIAMVTVSSGFSGRENIKTVAIEDVVPVADAVQSGKYRYFHEYGVVTLGDPSGLSKRFLELVTSPEGLKVLGRRGMIAIR